MHWYFLILLLSIHLFVDGASSTISPLLQRLGVHHQVSDATMGLVLAALSGCLSLSQPLFGYLFDRFRAYWLLPVSVLVMGICFACVGLADSLALLIVLVSVGGLASGVFHPAGTAMAGSLAHKRRPLIVAIFISAGAVGVAAGPWFMSRLVDKWGLGATIWLLAVTVPVLVAAVLAFLVYRKMPHSQVDIARRQANQGDPIPFGLLALLYCGAVSRAFVTCICFSGMSFLMAEKIPDESAALLSAGNNLAAFGLATGFGGLFSGLFLHPRSQKPAILYSLVLAVPFLLVFPHISGVWLSAALIVGILIVNSTAPLVTAIGQRLLPQSTALASSLFMGASWGVAAVLAPLAVTWLGSHISYAKAMPLLMAGGLLVSLAATIPLPRIIGAEDQSSCN